MAPRLNAASVAAFMLFGVLSSFADESVTAPAEVAGSNPPQAKIAKRDETLDEDVGRVFIEGEIDLINFQQPQPLAPAPQAVDPRMSVPAQANALSNNVFGAGATERSLLGDVRRARASGSNADVVYGRESQFRSTTDTGSLLGKSAQARGITSQNRTPIITDTRVRGSGTGNLLASGSYWVPARQDLDTMLSKIDSRIVDNVIVIKGPYSALYGPGTNFIDVALMQSPRFEDGPEVHGSTGVEYKTNGNQLYGRQTFWGGDEDWGFRIGYGNNTGDDYKTGNGDRLPSGFKSRDFDAAFGFDIDPDQHVEFSYLRLDQTDVQSPGQFFDINFLVTDAFELTYVLEDQYYFDRFTAEGYYNRTRFQGDAGRPSKIKQIPSIPLVTNNLQTDVDSMSTGYTTSMTWGDQDAMHLVAGTDFRYLKQGLNETNDFSVDVDAALAGALGIAPGVYNFTNANSAIPRSHWSNPGLFTELSTPIDDRLLLKTGGRVDWVSTDIDQTPSGLSSTLPNQVPLTEQFLLSQLRTDSFDKNFQLWSLFGTADYKLDDYWTAGLAAGTGMRPPTLTELYSTGEFLSVIQNGFNSVIGNPNLKASQHTQIDVSLRVDTGSFRAGTTGFYAWIRDFTTYEVVLFGALPEDNTRGLTFVNTPLATLSGFESYAEQDVNDWLTSFGTVSFVEGRDHTRNEGGQDFYNPAIAQFIHDPNAPRGILPGSKKEPLPGIYPMQARLGLRVHEPNPQSKWGAELSARIVDRQDRVASSLGELPTAGFTTYDLRTFWKPSKRIAFNCGVENFTNKYYREHLDLRTGRGVFQQGISFYFGSQLTY